MKNTNGLCFCPKDPKSKWTRSKEFDRVKKGYRIRKEFVGWCYIAKRELFDTISLHDEQFDFYFQDDDFALTLRKYNIPHYLVPNSNVVHLGGETSSITDGFGYNEKANKDRIIFHNKWGSQRMIAWKNRFADYLLCPLNLGFLLKYIY
ncbi:MULTISPECIES: hypothetical protein [unclassified Carboxylicivirga]|uniref:hypothetical protein n=1 Tax=Carboxylicivirga TaxID=1628153 RepID=UPI003D349D7E